MAELPVQRKKITPQLIVTLAVLIPLLILGVDAFFFNTNFLYAGTLEATLVDLSAQLESSIDTVSVYEGDHVKTDQELIVLSCENYKSDANLANSNYQRNLRLFQKGAISQETLDQFTNEKADADIRLDWCSIRSPIEGTVLNRYHEPGEFATPGTKLLTLANIKDIWAYIYVPQPKIASLKIGMIVEGILPEMQNRTFKGKIIKINSEEEFTPKNVQTQSERTRLIFGVKISFLGSNEEEILKPGMTIEIKLP